MLEGSYAVLSGFPMEYDFLLFLFFALKSNDGSELAKVLWYNFFYVILAIKGQEMVE